MTTPRTALSYRDAGVDIDAGNALVDAIKPLARATARRGADGALGGFGGLFDLKAAGFNDPILVAATDGVGTKLKIAIDANHHDTVGIDLVAMCVNDLIVQAAEPLLFLDYFATGALSVETGRAVVAGIAEGCKQAGCALIGGETAEMPGMYGDGDYDLAGFAIGAAERDTLLDGSAVAEGDLILGLGSSGIHSNGYSLVRKVVEREGLAFTDAAPFAPSTTLGEALLTPTRIYVKPVMEALRRYNRDNHGEAPGIRGIVHITGGGFYENLPRILPDALACRVNPMTWPQLPVFEWLADAGAIAGAEMMRTFNCGIGLVLIVDRETAPQITETLTAAGEQVFTIGSITSRDAVGSAVVIEGLSA